MEEFARDLVQMLDVPAPPRAMKARSGTIREELMRPSPPKAGSKISLRGPRLVVVIALAASAAFVPAAAASADPGVTPATVDVTLAPGGSVVINKLVETAEVSSNPDVMFLADTTGSMGTSIANVQSSIADIISSVRDVQPGAQFGASQYKDVVDAFTYQLDQAITDNDTDVTNAVNTWSAGGGGDTPEAQIDALYHLATDANVGWRTGSSRIIAWFGDAPGHDPSVGHTLADASSALQATGVRIIAVDVSALDQVPNESSSTTGQATTLADATGGLVTDGSGDVSQAILDGLSNLPAEVTPVVGSCDSALDVTFDPSSRTVDSGSTAAFDETISLSSDATPGDELTCEVTFTVNGGSDPAFVETIAVTVESGEHDFSTTVDSSAGGTLLINPQGANNLGTTGRIMVPPQSGPPTDVEITADLFGVPGETDATCGGNPCVGQGIEWNVSNPGAIKRMKVVFFETAALTGGASPFTAKVYKDGVLLPNCSSHGSFSVARNTHPPTTCVVKRVGWKHGGWKIVIRTPGEDPKGRV